MLEQPRQDTHAANVAPRHEHDARVSAEHGAFGPSSCTPSQEVGASAPNRPPLPNAAAASPWRSGGLRSLFCYRPSRRQRARSSSRRRRCAPWPRSATPVGDERQDSPGAGDAARLLGESSSGRRSTGVRPQLLPTSPFTSAALGNVSASHRSGVRMLGSVPGSSWATTAPRGWYSRPPLQRPPAAAIDIRGACDPPLVAPQCRK